MGAPESTRTIEDLSDISALFEDAARHQEEVSVADLVERLDRRTFGPLLLLAGLMAVSPLGAIPGMSIVTATLIVLIAGQALFRPWAWLPRRLLDFRFGAEKLQAAAERSRPWLTWIERPFHPRLTFLVDAPAFQLTAALCVILALTFYPLALVPMGVSVPGTAVIAFALGWTMRDGALVAIGLVMAAAAAVLLVWAWPL